VIKKSILNQMDIDSEVLYADFKWDSIIKIVKNQSTKLKEIPKYPQVKRDFALLIDNHVSFQQIHDISFQTEKKLLKEVTLFDVYQGKNLPEGKKSYAVSFTLLDTEKTLTDKQIDKIMSKLKQQFESEIGAELR